MILQGLILKLGTQLQIQCSEERKQILYLALDATLVPTVVSNQYRMANHCVGKF